MSNDIFEMNDAEHLQWLQEEGANFTYISEPTEENLCRLISEALRSIDKGDRARSFIDIANMSLALADKTLGADAVVPQCLVLHKH